MAGLRPNRRRDWTAVVLYVAVLLALQPRLGFWVDDFKARWGNDTLEHSVMVVLGFAGILFLALLVALWRRARVFERIFLVAALVLSVIGVLALEVPQERLHYLEYGLLSALLFGACSKPQRAWWRAAGLAIVAAVTIGYVDEQLQGWLWERRYFDWRDVALNARAALVGVMVAIPTYRVLLNGR